MRPIRCFVILFVLLSASLTGNQLLAQCSPPTTIVTQPADQSIGYGQTATMSVSAIGTSTLTYQWYQVFSLAAIPIVGATGSSYTTPALFSDADYAVDVIDSGCITVRSRTASVTVAPCVPQSIDTQPQSQTISSGQTATLSVGVSGTTPYSYQWYEGFSGDTSTPAPGPNTASSYTTPTLFSTTSYWVQVSNPCDVSPSESQTATAFVCDPPVILTQPQDQNIQPGQTATLSVEIDSGPQAAAVAAPPYQWYQGATGDTSTPAPGPNTGSTYTTPALNTTTQYWVRVSSGCASTDSRTATVAVCQIPTISTQPADQTVQNQQSATFTVSANGTATLAYQWYEGVSGSTATPAPGASSAASYTTPSLSQTTQYWVRVTNGCGTVDSVTATAFVCDPPVISSHPRFPAIDPGTSATLTVSAVGTNLQYLWYRGESGDTSNPAPGTNNGNTYETPDLAGSARFWVRVFNSCGTADSQTEVVTVRKCSTPVVSGQPKDATINAGEQTTLFVILEGSAPFTYQWYRGNPGDRSTPAPGTGTLPSYATGPLSGTTTFWVAVSNDCGSTESRGATITVNPGCGSEPLAAPAAAAPATVPDDRPYTVTWSAVPGALMYEVQESSSGNLADAITRTTSETSAQFTHAPGAQASSWFYRVRAIAQCNGAPGIYSPVVTVVVLPPDPVLPPPLDGLQVAVPEGSQEPVLLRFLLLPPPGVTTATFAAEADVPWLTVEPATGTVNSSGVILEVTADPSSLPPGSNFGTILIDFTFSPKTAAGRGIVPNGNAKASVPVTVSVVTPVAPASNPGAPPDGAQIVPVVVHAAGIGAQFVSDLRVANRGNQAATYDLIFVPTQSNGTETGKKTTITVQPNQTYALEDILKTWYGEGAASEGTKGLLEVRPLGAAGAAAATAVSSRTYAKTAAGTLGQFIPAIPVSSFIGASDQASANILSLQQVSQSASFRTNLGLVEGAGQSAVVGISVFDDSGQKLGEFTENLQPLEHRQLDQYLESKGITLNDGRIEVRVISGAGRVTTYASVIDNATLDPLLVVPAKPSAQAASRYVVSGLAALQNQSANFRSDMRIYNPGQSSVSATLRLFPAGAPGQPVTRTLSIAPGEVKVLNDVVASLFNLTSATGAAQVDPGAGGALIITARTYDQRPDGTVGQFISATRPEDAAGAGSRTLQVLQLEESDRFRTNLGLTEVTGQDSATVQITAIVPDAAAAPTMNITLQPNEFLQLNQVFKQMNLGRVYNGRITVKVVAGTGQVTAYGSVIDNLTQDPTFVPAQ
ncbi:MAG: hypothetical protein ABI718_15475 [Acidobacteriota bacterium]